MVYFRQPDIWTWMQPECEHRCDGQMAPTTGQRLFSTVSVFQANIELSALACDVHGTLCQPWVTFCLEHKPYVGDAAQPNIINRFCYVFTPQGRQREMPMLDERRGMCICDEFKYKRSIKCAPTTRFYTQHYCWRTTEKLTNGRSI